MYITYIYIYTHIHTYVCIHVISPSGCRDIRGRGYAEPMRDRRACNDLLWFRFRFLFSDTSFRFRFRACNVLLWSCVVVSKGCLDPPPVKAPLMMSLCVLMQPYVYEQFAKSG